MRKWMIGCAIVLVLLVATGFLLGPNIHTLVRARTQKVLATHFASTVEFSDLDISMFPRMHLTITGLVLRHKGRTDIPPMIEVRTVSIYAHLPELLRPRPHISYVQLDGLQIRTPPRVPGGEPLIQKTDEDLAKKYPLLITEVRADDANIEVLRAQSDKPPREFPIHHLDLHDVSFDRPAQFHALLTNAIPKGEIDATGEFGPWDAEQPSETPADGRYIFQNADLGTLKGLRGILSSKGPIFWAAGLFDGRGLYRYAGLRTAHRRQTSGAAHRFFCAGGRNKWRRDPEGRDGQISAHHIAGQRQDRGRQQGHQGANDLSERFIGQRAN